MSSGFGFAGVFISIFNILLILLITAALVLVIITCIKVIRYIDSKMKADKIKKIESTTEEVQ